MTVEVAGTRAEAAGLALPPLLVLEPLRDYLAAEGLGDGEPVARRIGGGQSNVTFLVETGGRRLVLRRGPRPPLPPSTHDMLREARVQRLLAEAGIPVPAILAVCADESVLGVPFYVMEYLDGAVVTDEVPAGLDGHDLVYAAVDALADLHTVGIDGGELATLGRPEGYLLRQVERFSALWPRVSRRELPSLGQVGDWLAAHLPESTGASVVHGDYRLGNLMYRSDAPASVLAILDWEMATLGDPLADLGYLVATYAEPGAVATPLELTPVTRGDGFPRRADLVDRYLSRTGADPSALAWYQVLALFKAAVFCEAIHTRWLAGERPGDEFAPTLTQGVPVLLAEAVRVTGGAR